MISLPRPCIQHAGAVDGAVGPVDRVWLLGPVERPRIMGADLQVKEGKVPLAAGHWGRHERRRLWAVKAGCDSLLDGYALSLSLRGLGLTSRPWL